MKHYFVGVLAIAVALAGCQPQEQEPRSNGFVNIADPAVEGKQWKMGTQEAVDFVQKLSDNYNAGDVDAVMAAVADTATFHFADGTSVTGKDSLRAGLTGYIDNMESYNWSLVFIYSVDLDLDAGGEWVFAGGDETRTPKGGEEETVSLLEAFYVVGDQIVEMYQYERKSPITN